MSKKMYGMVTEKSKVEIRGRKLPRWTYRVNKKTGKVTLTRLAWSFIRLYRLLPERPTAGPEGMATPREFKDRVELSRRVNQLMKSQGWRPKAEMLERVKKAQEQADA